MTDQVAKVIFLIGFMGSGKSHEGRLLSEQTGLPFIDLDEWIQQQDGRSITEIFNADGEAYFRNLEAAQLQLAYASFSDDLAIHIGGTRLKGIVATGGGTPCFHGSMDWMNVHGITIWLNSPIAVLAERLKREKAKRPLIAEINEEELSVFIKKKIEDRKPYYSIASIEIVDSVDVNSLIQKIQDA
jgi:shikimate kinase